MSTLSFWLLATLMAAATLAWLLPPLLRSRPLAAQAGESDNLTLLREQHAELQADRIEGRLDDASHRLALAELARRTLAETTPDDIRPRRAAPQTAPAWRTAAMLALCVPLLAAALYTQVGRPDALSPQPAPTALVATPPPPSEAMAGPAPDSAVDVEAMVGRLAERLQGQPEDLPGWLMLARSYTALGRFAEASDAYRRAALLTPDDPQLLADQADALAMAQGGRGAGEPTRLIERALQLNPDHLKALAMAGSAALERGDAIAAQGYFLRARQVASRTPSGASSKP